MQKYWLRGGIIGLVILVLIYLLSVIIKNDLFGWFGVTMLLLPLLLSDIILFKITNYHIIGTKEYWFTPNVLGYVLLVLLYFFVGASIGMIYQKIKNRKRKIVS